MVKGSGANTYIYVDKTDCYCYVGDGENKGSVCVQCRWFNTSNNMEKCHARAILKMDESIGQYRLNRTKEHNCDPERQAYPDQEGLFE